MKYFERSRAIRGDILSQLSLLNMARDTYKGNIEPFTFGGTVNIYHVGILPSGLHVALRAFRTEMPEGKKGLEWEKRAFEAYCRNAEDLSEEGEGVPDFCVGVIFGQHAGIFTEDLTRGDTSEFESHPDNEYVFVGPERRKVFVDIDYLFREKLLKIKELKYFLDSNLVMLYS